CRSPPGTCAPIRCPFESFNIENIDIKVLNISFVKDNALPEPVAGRTSRQMSRRDHRGRNTDDGSSTGERRLELPPSISQSRPVDRRARLLSLVRSPGRIVRPFVHWPGLCVQRVQSADDATSWRVT